VLWCRAWAVRTFALTHRTRACGAAMKSGRLFIVLSILIDGDPLYLCPSPTNEGNNQRGRTREEYLRLAPSELTGGLIVQQEGALRAGLSSLTGKGQG
jgi:hypothetical protein